jgi:hypothetical protein
MLPSPRLFGSRQFAFVSPAQIFADRPPTNPFSPQSRRNGPGMMAGAQLSIEKFLANFKMYCFFSGEY